MAADYLVASLQPLTLDGPPPYTAERFIELCRSQMLGMEPARRHEDGLSSPYQNALCSAFTRKKGRLFPWHARTPQTCHRGAAAQG